MLSRKQQEEYSQKRSELPYVKTVVQYIGEQTYQINQRIFKVIHSSSVEAINVEALADRYMSILDTYDYIVGDWSYDQLRLKGFYHDEQVGVPLDKKISQLPDYLLEYCSFGCEYFVLLQERDESQIKQQQKRISKKIEERKKNKTKGSFRKQSSHTNRSNNNRKKKRNQHPFQIQNNKKNNKKTEKKSSRNKHDNTKFSIRTTKTKEKK